MNASVRRCAALGAVILSASCGRLQRGDRLLETSVPPDVARDAYALYSSIYRSSGWLQDGEVLAIARTPLAIAPDEATQKCVQPKTAADRELAQSLPRFSKAVYLWSERFRFGRQYKLLDKAEAQEAIACIMHAPQPGTASCQPYAGIRFVRYISVPLFNRDHTRALVKVFRVCGGLCGEGHLAAYRKTDMGWRQEENSFAMCTWVS